MPLDVYDTPYFYATPWPYPGATLLPVLQPPAACCVLLNSSLSRMPVRN